MCLGIPGQIVEITDAFTLQVNVARKLHKKLKKGLKENDQLAWGFFKDNDHGDVLHLAVYDAFDQLFGSKE